MQMAAFILSAILTFLVFMVNAQCDQMLCVEGCRAFDADLHNCNFDHQVYSSLEACVCNGIGSAADNEQNLINCLSCGPDTPGSNTNITYGNWAVICGEYQLDGEATAISIENSPPATYEAFYSSQVLPALQSICPQAYGAVAQSMMPASSLATLTGPSASITSASATAAQGGSMQSMQSAVQQTMTAVSTGAAGAVVGYPYEAHIGMLVAAIGVGFL